MWEAVVSETKTEPLDLSRWPEPDIAQQLIDAYFTTDNLILPLLNRVLFQKAYDTGLWKSNHRFAKVCLLVFANAAKSIDDPRVYWYSGDPQNEREAYKNPDLYKHSAGWRWVQAVMKTGKSWLSVVALEDLQCFVVSQRRLGWSKISPRWQLFANFCFRSAVISTVWTVGGFGLKSCVVSSAQSYYGQPNDITSGYRHTYKSGLLENDKQGGKGVIEEGILVPDLHRHLQQCRDGTKSADECGRVSGTLDSRSSADVPEVTMWITHLMLTTSSGIPETPLPISSNLRIDLPRSPYSYASSN